MSDIWCQMWYIRHLMSNVVCQTSDVRCTLSDVWCLMWYVRHLMSDVVYQTSDVRCGIRRLMWYIRHLMSDSRILHSRTAKKTWQVMWRKRICNWQLSKLPWIWIFGAVIKLRTIEKNYYFGRLLWSCLKPQAGFAEREKKLYCRLDCSSEWLHSLYL